jgi:TetR/AcrR family transcriptional regulator, transcriptional repressor for nem operon
VRDNLVKAGLRLFHAGGYAGTGIDDIAGAAKVPKGSFYNHFDSKETFGADVVDAFFERVLETSRVYLLDERLGPLDRLKAYFDDRTNALRSAGYVRGCLLGNFGLEIGDHSAPIRQRIAAHFATWTDLFEDCIAQAKAQGAVRNPLPAATLARFVIDSWEGALLRARVDKSNAPLDAFREVIFGSVLV